METTRIALTPVRQAFVEIAGHRVLAFVLPGGQIAAAFRMICNILGVDHRSQLRRVQADPTISDLLMLVKIEIVGTPQEMNVIIAEAIPMWLANIHESKVAPEARETLMEFQRVAVQTLRAFFFPEKKEQPQSAPPKPEQHTPPLPPPDVTSAAAYDLLRAIAKHAAMVADCLEQEHQGMEAWKARLTHVEQEQRVLAGQQTETQRQLQALQAEVMALRDARKDRPPVADAALSDEHEETLRVLLYCAGSIVGLPMEQVEREMLAAAGVKKLGEIREADWFEMVVWLTQRLGR